MKAQNIIQSVILILLFSFCAISCSANGFSSNGKGENNTVTTDNFIEIKQAITEKIVKGDIPSLTVAVFENGKMRIEYFQK